MLRTQNCYLSSLCEELKEKMDDIHRLNKKLADQPQSSSELKRALIDLEGSHDASKVVFQVILELKLSKCTG